MKTISEIIGGAQVLLPLEYKIQDSFSSLVTIKQRSFIHHLRVIEEYLPVFFHSQKTGNPYLGDPQFLRAFLAKSFYQDESTKNLIQRLQSDQNLREICGFHSLKGLSESTFSRRFTHFSDIGITEIIHEKMVKNILKDELIGHLSRDSTSIATREKPVNKKKEVKITKKKRGRPKKDEHRVKEQTIIEQQMDLSASDALNLLNKDAAWGGKRNSAGNPMYWKGYKLHLDVTDYGLPVTAILTGANIHDSQLAIPMERISTDRVKYCYTLMDAAYNSPLIEKNATSLGHVTVIDPKKPKGGKKIPLDPAKLHRYKIRSTVERANSHLKDSFFSKRIYARKHEKVYFELMCGVLCLTAQKVLQYLILPQLTDQLFF